MLITMCAFGALTARIPGFQLAKTRGYDFDGISIIPTILVSLRNVYYIAQYAKLLGKTGYYRRILAISTAS